MGCYELEQLRRQSEGAPADETNRKGNGNGVVQRMAALPAKCVWRCWGGVYFELEAGRVLTSGLGGRDRRLGWDVFWVLRLS